jgi:hypothetical protein
MDEEYKRVFRMNWYTLIQSLAKNHKKISITDAYHVVKMCSKCDMNLNDFIMWDIDEKLEWKIEEIK